MAKRRRLKDVWSRIFWLGLAAVGGLITLVFFGLGILSPVHSAWQLWTIKQHQSRALGPSPGDGPGVFTGRLRGPADRRSPQGKPAAIWIATIQHKDGDDERTMCELSELSQAVLVDGATQLPFDPGAARSGESPINQSEWLSSDWHQVPWISDIPAAAIERCKLKETKDRRYADMRYAETLIQPDAPVTAIACLSGGRLVACGDEMDRITKRSLNAIVNGIADYWWLAKLALLIVALIMWGICASVVDSPRQLTERLLTPRTAHSSTGNPESAP